MEKDRLDPVEIVKELGEISRQGISADRKKLKQDMCAQFIDFREWVREYVVNAFDAMATGCEISGRENEEHIIIRIKDNGHGMDRQGVLNYLTLFRSVKFGDPEKTIGCHGAGKLSVAAIPGQSGFYMRTSTGRECWQLKTGSLLDDDPVTLHRMNKVPGQGTVFEITFKKIIPLSEELAKIKDVLEKYCRYLPMDITIYGKISSRTPWSGKIHWIRGDWNAGPEMMPAHYPIEKYGKRYEVILGIGTGRHSVYQNRVLISTSYDLLSMKNGSSVKLPYLDIRVNSPDFRPTFGRNRLTNEDFLMEIAAHLKDNLIPPYFNRLSDKSLSGFSDIPDMDVSRIEALACSILAHDVRWISGAAAMPIFRTRNDHFLSYNDLVQHLKRKNHLYLEYEDAEGIDFSVFTAPVLCLSQPAGGIEFIKKHFSSFLINLGLNDVVIEAPQGSSEQLGPREKNFEKYLGFHPDSLSYNIQSDSGSHSGNAGNELFFVLRNNGFLDKFCEESRQARTELKNIKWKVNYLVDRDGRTPNQTHRFLFKNNWIILNLNHEEIQKLLKLSTSAPTLAGHWAMAVCLSEGNSILKHLTPEAREDLLLIDAMTRCGRADLPSDAGGKEQKNKGDLPEENKWFDLELRNIDLWL